jgi:DNA polymerase-3 subunit gamma/tau
LRLLAQGAHGSMRDALSLTDQAIAYAAGQVTLDAVQGMLGALDQSYPDAPARRAGATRTAPTCWPWPTKWPAAACRTTARCRIWARCCTGSPWRKACRRRAGRFAGTRRHPCAWPTLFDAQEVQLYYQIAVHGRNELGLAPDEYAGFTMTLLRMLAFRPGNGGAEGVAPGGRQLRPKAPAPRPASAVSGGAASAVSPPRV